jgi:sialate O-acetylesterase
VFHQTKLTVACCLTLTAASVELRADVKLPALISDGMVLQQGVKANLWGTADPEERVTANFNNQQVSVVADRSGQWKLKLEPLSAGGHFHSRSPAKIALRCITFWSGRSGFVPANPIWK